MSEEIKIKNGNAWTVKKWQAILTLILLIGTILGQILFAQGWKVNMERDILDRPTKEETRKMIQDELLDFKNDIKDIRNFLLQNNKTSIK